MSRNKTYIKLHYENDRSNDYDPKDRADTYAEEMGDYKHRDVFNDREHQVLWVAFRSYIPNIGGVSVTSIENTSRMEFMKRKWEVKE